MRRLLIAAAIVGLAAPAFAAEPAPTAKDARAKQRAEYIARCQYVAERAGVPAQPGLKGQGGLMKPTEAPRARMELAVNRRIYGCPVPVLVPNDVEGK